MLLDAESLTIFDTIKDLGGLTLFIGGAVYVIMYLRKQNDQLVEKLEDSHEQRESKLLQVIKDSNDKHEECGKRYFELSSKWQEVVNNNTRSLDKIGNAVDLLTDKIEDNHK